MTRTRRLGSPILPLTRDEWAVMQLLADQHEATGAAIRTHCFPGWHAAHRRRTLRQLVARTLVMQGNTMHEWCITEGGRELCDTIDGLIAEIAAPGSRPTAPCTIGGCEDGTDDPADTLRFHLYPPRRETGHRVGGFARRRWTRGDRL